MGAAIRALGSLDKALYLFSTDGEKVYHVNAIPKGQVSKTFDGKIWLQTVADIVGGKVSQTNLNLILAYFVCS